MSRNLEDELFATSSRPKSDKLQLKQEKTKALLLLQLRSTADFEQEESSSEEEESTEEIDPNDPAFSPDPVSPSNQQEALPFNEPGDAMIPPHHGRIESNAPKILSDEVFKRNSGSLIKNYMNRVSTVSNVLELIIEKPECLNAYSTEEQLEILELARRDGEITESVKKDLGEKFNVSKDNVENILEWVYLTNEGRDLSSHTRNANDELLGEGKNERDNVTVVDFKKWLPFDPVGFVLPTFEEDKNVVKTLKISSEFIRFVRRHLRENKILIESFLPDLKTWKDNTWRLFAWSGNKDVGAVTDVLEECLVQSDLLREFLQFSTIILTEPECGSKSTYQYREAQFGNRSFSIGQYSVIPARCLFPFATTHLSLGDDVWNEALESSTPGRVMMISKLHIDDELDNETQLNLKNFDNLQRLHHLCLSEYIDTIGITDVRLTKSQKPLLMDWGQIASMVNTKDITHELFNKTYKDVVYALNPTPERHLPKILDQYESLRSCRIMCDTTGWLHVLRYLINKRNDSLVKLHNVVENWLYKQKQRKKKKNKGIRYEVEQLKQALTKERVEVKDIQQKLPKVSDFDEMYKSEHLSHVSKSRHTIKVSPETVKQLQHDAKEIEKQTRTSPKRLSSISKKAQIRKGKRLFALGGFSP